MSARPSEGNPAGDEPQPIPCECWRFRQNLMGPHRSHLAEYERSRRLGTIPDDVWWEAIQVEAQLPDGAA